MRSVVLLLVGYCTVTFADDCSTVIALSRVRNISISDQNAVEANAANFCSEYSSSHGQSSSASFGASYSFLAASFGGSSATVDQVASRYCSASSHYSASSDAYKNYVETVAPGAYDAYRVCVQSNAQNLNYSVNLGSILDTSFAISASFPYIAGARPAEVKYAPGPGVHCHWDNSPSEGKTKIETGHSEILQCFRTDSGRDTYVTVQMTTAAVPPLTLRWPAYKDGVPVSALSDLERSLAELTKRIGTDESNVAPYIGGPRYILSATCPADWRDLGSVGIIMFKNDYKNSPFAEGGDRTDAPTQWKWTHPRLCAH